MVDVRSKIKKHIIIILSVLVIGFFGLVAIQAVVNRVTCNYYGTQTKRDTHYAAFVGCMVKVGDVYVPRSELRVTQ